MVIWQDLSLFVYSGMELFQHGVIIRAHDRSKLELLHGIGVSRTISMEDEEPSWWWPCSAYCCANTSDKPDIISGLIADASLTISFTNLIG